MRVSGKVGEEGGVSSGRLECFLYNQFNNIISYNSNRTVRVTSHNFECLCWNRDVTLRLRSSGRDVEQVGGDVMRVHSMEKSETNKNHINLSRCI